MVEVFKGTKVESWTDRMKTIGIVLGITSSVVGLLAFFGGIIWHVASLESRVRRVEQQVHTLTLAPAIAAASTTVGAPGKSDVDPSELAAATPNPIADLCADMARKAVSEVRAEGSTLVQFEAEKMLRDLGCIQTPAH